MRPLWTIGLFGFAACSAPNPYLDDSETSRSTTNFLVTTMPSSSATSSGTLDSGASTSEPSTSTAGPGETTNEAEDTVESNDVSDPTEPTDTNDPSEGTTSGTASDGETTGATEGVGMCPAETHRCLPAPPEGWRGPVAGWQGAPAEQPPCPSDLPDSSIDGGMDLQGTGTNCVCECTPSANTGCSRHERVIAGASGCATPGFRFVPANDSCTPVQTDIAPEDLLIWAAQGRAPVNSGRCNETSSSSYDEPYFAERFASCRPRDSFPICEDGSSLCTPVSLRQFEEGMCIYRPTTGEAESDGPSACPEGYPEHRVIYGSEFTDTRSCSDCQCGSAPEGECSGWVELFGQPCEGSSGSDLIDTIDPQEDQNPLVCYTVDRAVRGVRWRSTTVDARCSRSGGRAEGSVEPVSGTVVCCAGPQAESETSSTSSDASSG